MLVEVLPICLEEIDRWLIKFLAGIVAPTFAN